MKRGVERHPFSACIYCLAQLQCPYIACVINLPTGSMHKLLICLTVLSLQVWSTAAYSQDNKDKLPLPIDWLEVLLSPGRAVDYVDMVLRFNRGEVIVQGYDISQHTFFSPPGLDIIDADWKLLAKVPTVMILYSNGTGQLIEILTDGSKLVQFFDVNSASKELFRRIKGDDLYAISSGGAYVSRDSAKTWQPSNDGLTGVTDRNDLALDSSQNIWLGSNLGLHKQALTSNTWSTVPAAGEEGILSVFVDQLDRIWIKSYSWLKVSSDGGASFIDAPEGLIPGTFIRFGEDLAGNIYAVSGIAEFNGAGSAVYRSA